MVFHLFAVIAVGFAAAGTIMMTVRSFGYKTPKVVYLSAAGAAMITYNIWEEYSWYDRNALPMEAEGMTIVQTYSEANVWQPWTFAYPRTTRFMAWKHNQVDKQTVADLRYGELHLVTRRADIVVVPQVYDCDQALSAELLGDAITFDENNRPTNIRWAQLDRSDPLFSTVCGLS